MDGSPDAQPLIRQILEDSFGYLYPSALRVVARLGVADALAEGPRTDEELAERVGAAPDHLSRVMRFLSMRGVFRRSEHGPFELTPAAQLLRTDHPQSLRSLVLLLTHDIYWQCAGRLDESVRSGGTAFEKVFGAPLFEYLDRNPEAAEVFHAGVAESSAVEREAIVTSYSFPDTGTVVDVGGGSGGMLEIVLSRNPKLHGILFDQDSVVKEHRIREPSVAGRWTAVAGNFFDSVPAGADIYILKRIVHDWNDSDSVRLLCACREAMPDHAKLLIVDAVVPSDDRPHISGLYDIAMMALFDGRERTAAELEELTAAAGLRIERIIETPGPLSIIEARRAGT